MAGFDVDVDMGDDPAFDEDFQPPPTSRNLDQQQYHIALQDLGERLQNAMNAAFPNDHRIRYFAVHVLMLFWEDEDPKLPVSIELDELGEVFENVYRFEVEKWGIPSEGSHKKLNHKVLDFIERGGDSKEDLKIVYYGGHGMLAQNRQPCWASRPTARDPSFCTVKWGGIQNALEEAKSDILLLLDCCASGTANTSEGSGITELIAACSFNASANPVGPDSFTRALITELRLLSTAPSFTVGVLYNRILCRIQNWMPAGREMQKSPLHVVLTQDKRLPIGIQISPLRTPRFPVSRASGSSLHVGSQIRLPLRRPASSSSTATNTSSFVHSMGSVSPGLQSASSSISSVPPDQEQFPRIALTIRLKESLTASQISEDLFIDWLRIMPIHANQVKVEAGFASLSTLIVISVPIASWCYIASHPAITVFGLIKSVNLLHLNPEPSSVQVAVSDGEVPLAPKKTLSSGSQNMIIPISSESRAIDSSGLRSPPCYSKTIEEETFPVHYTSEIPKDPTWQMLTKPSSQKNYSQLRNTVMSTTLDIAASMRKPDICSRCYGPKSESATNGYRDKNNAWHWCPRCEERVTKAELARKHYLAKAKKEACYLPTNLRHLFEHEHKNGDFIDKLLARRGNYPLAEQAVASWANGVVIADLASTG